LVSLIIDIRDLKICWNCRKIYEFIFKYEFKK